MGVNRTLRARKFPWRTIDADEIFGDETQKGARFAGWLMGFHRGGELDNIRDGTITAHAFAILVRQRDPSEEMKKRAEERKAIAKKLRFTHNHRPRKRKARGVAIFEEDQVASWMVKFLKKSRASGWDGQLISGFRSPQFSESLCLDMCGQPSCPGRCAGKNSNHSGLIHPAGAIDVSPESAAEFASIQRRIGSPLRNDMPTTDPNHFSISGH
ncbi:MAG: hypothetical protein M3277_10655 [Actinomycetota bacterium]|nr:hypothetical protein [Actinomycetota bacterium]